MSPEPSPASEADSGNASEFHTELQALINKYSRENRSDTPDFILAEYLETCLKAFESATRHRDEWHSFKPFEYLNS